MTLQFISVPRDASLATRSLGRCSAMAISALPGAAGVSRGLKAQLLATECRHAQANTPGYCSPGLRTRCLLEPPGVPRLPQSTLCLRLRNFSFVSTLGEHCLGDVKMSPVIMVSHLANN